MPTETTLRMMSSAPDYYLPGSLFESIQDAIAVELEQLKVSREGTKLQRRIETATWGLKYWEQLYRIPTVETDSYEVRRSRVLGKKRGIGKLSTALVQAIARAYSGDVDVIVNLATYEVKIKFVGSRGVPSNLDDLKAQLENVMHAHLGIVYEFTYLTFGELDAENLTAAQFDALNYTWAQLETWRP